ncbi:MAG: TatD family hydrolase [Candidatus Dormibacteraeota bacterium]|uniref:TatD family hydrolase n=1 Tax=Candidatus Amunia macphersoniae TaxID=3127014 RepID=A0A934KPL9_9BACT|nr:TatD family hydrolase [Candidatus Dormibacteraeota bacterium]
MTDPLPRQPLVDTHCHLVLLDERGLLDAALESAAEAGVEQIVSVGLNVDDSDCNRRVAESHDNVWFTVGWHPHQPHPPDAAELRALDQLLDHPRAVAVGEIGLDLFFRPGYHDTPLDEQLRAMHAMLDLADAHHKPVVVHDRDAHGEVLVAIRQHPGVRGVMHCFSGDAEFGRECVAAGYALSFSGIVTFPRSQPIQQAAAAAADGDFVVETDSPFLAPVPHRGRPNLPGYVDATAAAVARLRGVDEQLVRAQTTANARRLFGLPGRAE